MIRDNSLMQNSKSFGAKFGCGTKGTIEAAKKLTELYPELVERLESNITSIKEALPNDTLIINTTRTLNGVNPLTVAKAVISNSKGQNILSASVETKFPENNGALEFSVIEEIAQKLRQEAEDILALIKSTPLLSRYIDSKTIHSLEMTTKKPLQVKGPNIDFFLKEQPVKSSY